MSRVAQSFNKTKQIILIAVFVVSISAGLVATKPWDTTSKPVITQQQSQTTYVKYQGKQGQNALSLLKKYTTVAVKHYSFGDQVTSINGTQGNGPKYWSFYVNGKLADVGAGTYVTKSSDVIEWKLQKL
ncbi:MAG TPA: DUF4430 domain-containing protein [Candidatus Saccharimonadales bacterium]|nr:DUF4430 domain-containing protein [Candidatus Saccharimonadales bacterium]